MKPTTMVLVLGLIAVPVVAGSAVVGTYRSCNTQGGPSTRAVSANPRGTPGETVSSGTR